MFLDYYTHLQLELFMASVSGYNGMCEVTPYMEAITTCCGISHIYHTLQCYITCIPRHSTLIFTSSVVHIYNFFSFTYFSNILCAVILKVLVSLQAYWYTGSAFTRHLNHIHIYCITRESGLSARYGPHYFKNSE